MPEEKFNPTDEVPSLELCKRLREQGYPQDGGGWYWLIMRTEEGKELASLHLFETRPVPLAYQDYIKAPTLREIGERLPDKIEANGFPFYLIITRLRSLWEVYYGTSASDMPSGCVALLPPVERSHRAPDTCASVWLWLEKNGYLKEEQ